MKEISIEIDSLGRVKKKGKGLGQQYENNVTKYAITLDSSLVNPTYFYYIIVVPPTSTGKKMYAVPMLTENFEYVISSAITQYVGTWKFCMLIMHKELSGVDTIPVEGVVKITDEWEDEVEKGIIDNVQLEEQIADINLQIAYEELLLVKQEVESAAEYAELQGAYAKNVADQLLEDKESGAFTGNPGPKGNDGVSPTAKVEQKVGGALLVVNDANGTTTAELKDGQTPYIGPNGNWWVGNQDTGTRPDSDYVLPPAGKEYLGGLIVGDNLDVTDEGVVSVIDTPKYNDETVLSGTEIEIDSVLAIESNLQLSGNSEQDSRSGKNLYDENNAYGVTISGEDLIYANNGTTIISGVFEENTQYTFQGELKQGISGSYARLHVYYTDGTSKDAMLNSSTEYAYKTYTSDVGKTIKEVKSYGANMLYIKRGTFQIEKGTIATSYEAYGVQPSPEFPSEIKSVTGDVEVKVEGKNSVSETQNAWIGSDGSINNAEGNIISNFIEVQTGESYILSGYYPDFARIVRAYQIAFYDSNYNFISRQTGIPHDTAFTVTDSKIKYIRGWIDRNSTSDPIPTYLQIEKGTIVTSYEPYKLITVSLPLGDIELRSILDSTRDTIARISGVWNKISNVESIMFDGSEDEDWGATATYMYVPKTALVYPRRTYGKGFCTHFINDATNNTGTFILGNAYAFSFFTEYTTKSEWEAWLADNPITVDYELETPIYTPVEDQTLINALDELEELILHQGYNYITATAVNGVKAHLDLSIPSTASVTNVIETESGQDLIVPVISSTSNVKLKTPAIEKNQMKLNPKTGLVKIKDLVVNNKPVATLVDIIQLHDELDDVEEELKRYTDEEIEGLQYHLFQRGMILMWSGSIDTIPKGWVLCDGSNGTPNLRDRFIVGAGNLYNVGSTGGSASVTLTEEQIPSHTHSGTTSEVSGEISYAMSTTKSGDSSTNTFVSAIGSNSGIKSATAEVHTHTFTTEATGSGEAIEILPPYYALAYIMKL